MRILILLAALAACAPVPPAETPAETQAGTCSAEAAGSLVGKPYSAGAIEQARVASGSKAVRVIRPGMAVTMDYRIDRLNVDLDEKDVVTRVHCG